MDRASFRLPLAVLCLVAATILALFMTNVGVAVVIMVVGTVAATFIMALGRDDAGPAANPAPVPSLRPMALFDHPAFHTLIDHDARAILGLSAMGIALANDTALKLLGRHIAGADVRTAIRHPGVIDALQACTTQGDARSVDIVDFQRPGDRWQIAIVNLGDSQNLLMLDDRSAIDAADRMRSDFVANASHELRTPLAAILGYVETLGQMEPGEAEPVMKRFLGIIDREARRMQQLVADLISISRIEADRYRRPTTEVDLAELLRRTVSDIRVAAPARGADIQLTLIEAATMAGDAAQLTQLMHNIIGNAMKYGRAGTPVAVALSDADKSWILSVGDVGDGIAPEHLPRLTERFYRVDDARSRAVGGTGLGLAIVKHIAERHRGRLSIESEVGKGTTVSLILPKSGNE
ncbi:MAG: two-component sensor histidine kinase [Sphingopyxis sp.]|nr:two-component sensor histidine kinase [Sphingopyxis sp.]